MKLGFHYGKKDINKKPLIGIICCTRILHDLLFHAAAERYATAILKTCEATPILIPSLNMPDIFAHLDGILMTGSVTNVEPHHYNGEMSRPGTLHDPQRDETSLTMIRTAIHLKIPMLAICRGNQELNVAMGGSLFQNVHEVTGRMVHHEDLNLPVERRFDLAHKVFIKEDGKLSKILPHDHIMVNSLHHQAIDRLGHNLNVEAEAEDGTIEAVSVKGEDYFGFGVQWHPEWQVERYPQYVALFKAFNEAVQQFHKSKS